MSSKTDHIEAGLLIAADALSDARRATAAASANDEILRQQIPIDLGRLAAVKDTIEELERDYRELLARLTGAN